MIRDLIIGAAACATLTLTAWCAGPTQAHQTAPGWAYDATCCSGHDCAPVRVQNVTATPSGWRVHIEPGDHPMATRVVDVVIPFDSKKVRHSQDSDFHVCVFKVTQSVLCIYVPDMLG